MRWEYDYLLIICENGSLKGYGKKPEKYEKLKVFKMHFKSSLLMHVIKWKKI